MEWDSLFLETVIDLASNKKILDGKLVTNLDGIISVGQSKLHSGTKSIIDNILI